MRTLALTILLASSVLASQPSPGALESSKIRLDAQDPAGALADAESALASGGGADAYAARADAKRALGRPIDEVVADYAEAAKRDPRYLEKYNGLIVQRESQRRPGFKSKPGGVAVGSGVNGLAELLGVAALCAVLAIAAMVLLLGRGES